MRWYSMSTVRGFGRISETTPFSCVWTHAVGVEDVDDDLSPFAKVKTIHLR